MKIKLEKINKLESLGFEKGRIYYNRGNLRVKIETGDIDIKVPMYAHNVEVPSILKTLILEGFIEE